MSELKKQGYRISAVFAALALMALALVAGCGGGGEEDSSGGLSGGYKPPARNPGGFSLAPAGAPAAAPAAAPDPAAAPAAGGAQVAAGAAPAAPVGPSGPPLPTEEEKAERLAAFAGKYGPVTQSQVKDWDGRSIEFVNFTHEGMKISLPLSMVAEAKDPEALEGYFKIYPASAVPRRAASTTQVSASGAGSAEADEEAATAEETGAEAAADASARDDSDSDSSAEPATSG